MKRQSKFALLFLLLLLPVMMRAADRGKYNFNPQWLVWTGDAKGAEKPSFNDRRWEEVTLPRAWNEDITYKVSIDDMTTGIVWYRKHFRLPETARGGKVFVEFEGVRQGADFWLNGEYLGLHENGVMAVGFDLTPYIDFDGDNVIALRIDNNWDYQERESGVRFQWNNRNFNSNYGGIPKNVWLHVTPRVYQTLPLYSNLGTTGVYVYATDIRTKEKRALITAESEIRNELDRASSVAYEVELVDYEGKTVSRFGSDAVTVPAGGTATLKASAEVGGLHFWSVGYGYLYDVRTRLIVDGKPTDEVTTRTGFRKTRFGSGKIWLNDRVLMMKGYAQRTSNEWPGVGLSVPPWMSDFSNGMLIDHNANFFRWMHVTPWKQDVESCDRMGVIQVMPAGDAEKDVEGRQWEQRTALMRDAIIYNRNNPSILFYESGNESISREHMVEMVAIRNLYDPHGGRAMGSREMLDIREAEWGGEMLYINKSEHHPMFQTEYCRDEGLRKYWDEWSYPYHPEGEGPLHRGQDASAYNHNQDQFAVELVRRWYDYYRERPGTGRRVNSGGAKIIFSDTQTHHRGLENYRRSGVVDALRIPKDGYFAHKVMWDGWVDNVNHDTYIVGHWNYDPQVTKPVIVVSTGDRVELLVNGKSKGFGRQDYHYLYTFDNVQWEPGTIEAVSYDENGNELSRTSKKTVGEPAALKLTLMQGPNGFHADGADIALLQFEVVDANGDRCPLANDMVKFTVSGPAQWRGGLAQGPDNYTFRKEFPVECGVNRALIRSTTTAGQITVRAEAKGLGSESVTFTSFPVKVTGGISEYIPSASLPSKLDGGETPETPSYEDTKVDVKVVSAVAGANGGDAWMSWDDNELSEWKNDGRLNTAWITYELERYAEIDDICIKLTGWRLRSYPLEVYAGDQLIWSGDTDRSLGYVHLNVKPVRTRHITIRLKGAAMESDAFGQIIEVAEPAAGELDLFKAEGGDRVNSELRIVEVEFLESLRR